LCGASPESRGQEGRSRPSSAFSSVPSDAKQFEAQLTQQANYDALTRLPNRNLLLDRIAQAIAVAQRQQSRAMVAFLDLDRFKFVNDSFGHDVGDDLLREVASRLLECVRKSDTVARLGGDEFVIVLNHDFTDDVSLPLMRCGNAAQECRYCDVSGEAAWPQLL